MTKSQVIAKSSPKKGYKEFFKKRHPVYEAQYPSISEQELVNLIIQQFENLNSEQALRVTRGQMALEPLNLDGSNKKKKPTPNGTELADSGNKSKPSAMKEMKQESQFKNIEQSYSSQLMQTPKSTKQIMKQAKAQKTEYLKFFSFYYDKLHNQHPKWVPNQITTIIKLLWKKKNNNSSLKSRKSSIDSTKSMKKMSGYEAFKREHIMKADVPSDAIRESWNRLPKESKNYWEKRGQHQFNKIGKQTLVVRMKNPMKMEESSQKMETQMPKMNLNFMSKKM